MIGRRCPGRLALWIAVIATAALVRVVVIHARPVWKDERHTIGLAQASSAEIVRSLSADVHPPLYFLVVRGWGRAFGVSAASLRGFSAVCGMAMLALLFVAGRRWIGTDGAAAAMLFAAFSPIHIYYSAEARSYTFVELLFFASVFSTVESAREADRRWPAIYVATMTAALYTHYWCAFVFLAANLYWLLFVRPFDDRRWHVWVAAQIVVAIMLLPWLAILPGQLSAGHGDWIRRPPFDAPLKTLFRFTTGWDFLLRSRIVRAVEIVLSVPYLVVLASGSLRAADGDEVLANSRRDLVFFFAVPILASYLFSLLLKPMYVIGRFEVIVFPMFALLVGRGFVRVGRTAQGAVVSALAITSVLYVTLVLGTP
jgi:hypothetical protein